MTQQNRIHNGKFGELPIRTYKTLVGSTDNVLDQDLAEATERIQKDCGDILSKFSDPGPIIDCVLAYYFLNQQSPGTISECDRNNIDKMFETLKQFCKEDRENGSWREAVIHEDPSRFEDLPEIVFIKDRALDKLREAIGYRRFQAWEVNPKRGVGRNGEWETVREESEQRPMFEKLFKEYEERPRFMGPLIDTSTFLHDFTILTPPISNH